MRPLSVAEGMRLARGVSSADLIRMAEPTKQRSSRGGVIVSLLFWLAMIVACGLYAVVALSPKIVRFHNFKKRHYETQVRLVSLERQVKYLRKVEFAFEHDRDFAAEQARVDFGAARPGERRIPAKEPLELEAVAKPALPRPNRPLPWYAPLLVVFSEDQELRRGLLATAAVITLLAFTFLHESQLGRFKDLIHRLTGGFKRATSRYCNWKSQGGPGGGLQELET